MESSPYFLRTISHLNHQVAVEREKSTGEFTTKSARSPPKGGLVGLIGEFPQQWAPNKSGFENFETYNKSQRSL